MVMKRQHENSQNVIQSHDDAGPGLGHAELINQSDGNGGIVCLPEGGDQEKGKANQNCPFVIEFHK